jgi:hypothetical protein
VELEISLLFGRNRFQTQMQYNFLDVTTYEGGEFYRSSKLQNNMADRAWSKTDKLNPEFWKIN